MSLRIPFLQTITTTQFCIAPQLMIHRHGSSSQHFQQMQPKRNSTSVKSKQSNITKCSSNSFLGILKKKTVTFIEVKKTLEALIIPR